MKMEMNEFLNNIESVIENTTALAANNNSSILTKNKF